MSFFLSVVVLSSLSRAELRDIEASTCELFVPEPAAIHFKNL
jgi:hypothetical protein